MTVHIYADETKENGFVLAAAMVPASRAAELRALIQSLKLPRQRRIHFTTEKPERREMILEKLIKTGAIETLIMDARRIENPIAARRAAVGQLADEAVRVGAVLLRLEPDGPAVVTDKQTIFERLQRAGCAETVSYSHIAAVSESLLAVPDAVAWCYGKGGKWLRHAEPLIGKVITLGG